MAGGHNENCRTAEVQEPAFPLGPDHGWIPHRPPPRMAPIGGDAGDQRRITPQGLGQNRGGKRGFKLSVYERGAHRR